MTPTPSAVRVSTLLSRPAHALAAVLALGAPALASVEGSTGAAHGCTPAACRVEQPSVAERGAMLADAARMLTRYAADTSALGRQCRRLGEAMRDRIDDVRMLPFMWRAEDADGQLAPVTGDAHPVEVAAGTGRVHIARGFDPLNPDRGLAAVLQTARHEFAHLNGARQWDAGADGAARLAVACGPDAAP